MDLFCRETFDSQRGRKSKRNEWEKKYIYCDGGGCVTSSLLTGKATSVTAPGKGGIEG